MKPGRFHGQSFLLALSGGESAGHERVFASHTFHEVTMYYPMRAVRERRFKLIWNLIYETGFPFARDLWESSTWQSVLQKGDSYYADRKIEAFIHRPEFELYDLTRDPHEIDNLASNAEYRDMLIRLKEKLRKFQNDTGDPWIVKWERD